VQNGQLVSAGNAGTLTLTAGDSIRVSHSTVATTATRADGGDIKFTAPNLIFLENARVESSVGGGALTTGGNINIDPQAVVLQNSQVLANAFQGTGGNISIAGNVVLVDPASLIDASSQQSVSGQVVIQAPVSNLAAALSRLSQKPLNAAELLTARCAARLREGQVSSLTVAGRDGVPPEPGKYSPGVLIPQLARVARLSPATQPDRPGSNPAGPRGALFAQGAFDACRG
jgi:large exoprotein involved in heme utilization and adhesion